MLAKLKIKIQKIDASKDSDSPMLKKLRMQKFLMQKSLRSLG